MAVKNAASRSNPYTVYPGVAAEDIVRDSQTLSVICPELQPHATEGDLGAATASASITLNNRTGGTSSANNTLANHFVATWEGNGYMRYPPMVRKGEPVELFRRSDQDKWYWRETGRGANYRSTDRICISVSATKDNIPTSGQATGSGSTDPAIKDDTTTYSAEVNTMDQYAELRTSKANGEACAWRARFDAKTGMMSVTDDTEDPGNRILLDTGKVSGTPAFQVNLSTGIMLKFNNKDGEVFIPEKLVINAGNRIVMNSPLTIFNKQKVGAVIMNGAQLAINMSQDMILTAGNVVGIQATAMKVSSIIAAAGFRGLNFIYAAVGSMYNAVSVSDPLVGNAPNIVNSADTNMAAGADRPATAQPQFASAMSTATQAFAAIAAKIGVGSVGSALNDAATQSKIDTIQGK